jgi:hypothetical protein
MLRRILPHSSSSCLWTHVLLVVDSVVSKSYYASDPKRNGPSEEERALEKSYGRSLFFGQVDNSVVAPWVHAACYGIRLSALKIDGGGETYPSSEGNSGSDQKQRLQRTTDSNGRTMALRVTAPDCPHDEGRQWTGGQRQPSDL